MKNFFQIINRNACYHPENRVSATDGLCEAEPGANLLPAVRLGTVR